MMISGRVTMNYQLLRRLDADTMIHYVESLVYSVNTCTTCTVDATRHLPVIVGNTLQLCTLIYLNVTINCTDLI